MTPQLALIRLSSSIPSYITTVTISDTVSTRFPAAVSCNTAWPGVHLHDRQGTLAMRRMEGRRACCVRYSGGGLS